MHRYAQCAQCSALLSTRSRDSDSRDCTARSACSLDTAGASVLDDAITEKSRAHTLCGRGIDATTGATVARGVRAALDTPRQFGLPLSLLSTDSERGSQARAALADMFLADCVIDQFPAKNRPVETHPHAPTPTHNERRCQHVPAHHRTQRAAMLSLSTRVGWLGICLINVLTVSES